MKWESLAPAGSLIIRKVATRRDIAQIWPNEPNHDHAARREKLAERTQFQGWTARCKRYL